MSRHEAVKKAVLQLKETLKATPTEADIAGGISQHHRHPIPTALCTPSQLRNLIALPYPLDLDHSALIRAYDVSFVDALDEAQDEYFDAYVTARQGGHAHALEEAQIAYGKALLNALEGAQQEELDSTMAAMEEEDEDSSSDEYYPIDYDLESESERSTADI